MPQIPHLPSHVTSTGSLIYFKRSRKPASAGNATNCLSCRAEPDCIYSAKKIYEKSQLAKGNAAWPVAIIDPEIEDLFDHGKTEEADKRLRARLAEDYDDSTPGVDQRSWYGRCVYEASNDVCDDQFVTIEWEDNPLSQEQCNHQEPRNAGRGAKHATFHMVAWTEKQCERRGRIYGTKGEIEYDSKMIRVYDFATKQAHIHHPPEPGGGHGGGDAGLAMAFFRAVHAVKTGQMAAAEAQRVHIGCTLHDIIRSHAMVFAAEEARREKKVVNWAEWWEKNIGEAMNSRASNGGFPPHKKRVE